MTLAIEIESYTENINEFILLNIEHTDFFLSITTRQYKCFNVYLNKTVEN